MNSYCEHFVYGTSPTLIFGSLFSRAVYLLFVSLFFRPYFYSSLLVSFYVEVLLSWCFFGIVKVLVPKISQINLKRLLKAFLHTLCTFRVEFFLGDASGALHPFLVSVFVRRKGKKNSLEFVCWQNDWEGNGFYLSKTLIFFCEKWFVRYQIFIEFENSFIYRNASYCMLQTTIAIKSYVWLKPINIVL